MLICHNCGAPIENKARQCHRCHTSISSQAAVSVAESIIDHSLKIGLENQTSALNRIIAKDLLQASIQRHSITEPRTANEGSPNTKHFLQSTGGNGHNGHNKDSSSSATTSETIKTDSFFLSLPENEATKVSQTTKQIDFFAQLPPIAKDEELVQVKEQAKDPIEEKIVEKDQTDPSNWLSQSSAEALSKDKIPQTPLADKTPALDKMSNEEKVADPFDINKEDVHRRSFSGNAENTVSDNVKKSFVNQLKAEEDSSIFNQIRSRFFSGISNNSLTNTTEKSKANASKLYGLKPWQIGLIAIMALFLLYKGFETFCVIGSNLFGGIANQTFIQGNAISGRWQFAASWNNGSCNGQLILHQTGNQIFGEGRDNQYGNYKFNGNRNGNHIDFLKQYYVGNSFVGHPIELHGDLDPNNKPAFISGNFTKEYMEGGKWRGKPVVLAGIWEAEMIQPLIEDNSAPGYVPLIQKRDERPAASYGGFFSNLSKYGTWMAIFILGGGAFLYYLARALIGPDGWLGIWDKQRYVPAQFMREHKREKKQLSRPLTKGSLPLGQRWEWKPWQKPFFWIPRYLAIPPDLRVNSPHLLILGGGEKGKSRLMAHMIIHDIESADRAIVLVDSDGDLADLLLRWIASQSKGEEYAKRTIIIDPTSNLPCPSFNPLELPDDHDLQNAASSIVNGFKAIYHEPPGSQNQWSPQTAHILRNSAMLLMANGKTLLDLPTLLQDNDFRDILLEKIEQKRKERVEYSTLLETWGQYKRLARTEQWINWYEPILNRVGPTLINQRLRPILTQPKGDINLKQIIAEKKILIVKIPKGQLHEDANLLGSLIVTGMKQAAISLCTDGKIVDRTAAMYLDEFDHFIEKETLDAITTETKKFQLGFIGATKTLQHLPEDWRNQIEANIGTMCVFALTKKDGDMLGPRMFRVSGRKAKHRTLMNIFNPINTSPQFELISDEEKYNIDRVLAQSERQFYAYRVGAEAGIFRMKSLDFNDIPDNQVNTSLLDLMYKNR